MISLSKSDVPSHKENGSTGDRLSTCHPTDITPSQVAITSGRQDSNLRSPAPKAGALATTLRPVVDQPDQVYWTSTIANDRCRYPRIPAGRYGSQPRGADT